MATCGPNTCGVGGWGGPLPGDPSNNSLLSATPAFGGIDVTWTLPTTNPHAVAYSQLYRGLTDDIGASLRLPDVSGGFYYDKLDAAVRYYYWIRHVSINGTVGELIGPASAVAMPLIGGMIELLTGQIDRGLLSTLLRSELDQISIINSALLQEVTDRETGETTLSQAIADVQAGVADAHTFILNETANRTTQNSALIEQINGVAVTLNGSIATVNSQLTASITAVDDRVTAQAGRIDQLIVDVDGDLAGIQTTLQASIQTVDGRVTGLAGQLTQVETSLGEDIAAVNTYAVTQIGNTNGLVSDLTSNLATVSGTVNSLGSQVNALWVTQLTVNGLVGGFALANNGSTVEAAFDVDLFWIGRTNANKRKPFIIEDDVVYIDEAAINQLTFSKLRDESGSFIVEDGKIKANYLEAVEITADNITVGALRGINVNAGSFTTRGSFTTAAVAAGATTVPLHNTTDFAVGGGTAYIFDSTNDRDTFTYTGKTATELTGCIGVLDHIGVGKTVVPWNQPGMVIDALTNEMRYFGNRGDGVIDELATIGRQQVGGDYTIARFGNASSSNLGLSVQSSATAASFTSSSSGGATSTIIVSNSGGGRAMTLSGPSSDSTLSVFSSAVGDAISGVATGSGHGGYFQGNATRAGIRIENSSSGWPTNRARGQITFNSRTIGEFPDQYTLWVPAYSDGTNWRWFSDNATAA